MKNSGIWVSIFVFCFLKIIFSGLFVNNPINDIYNSPGVYLKVNLQNRFDDDDGYGYDLAVSPAKGFNLELDENYAIDTLGKYDFFSPSLVVTNGNYCYAVHGGVGVYIINASDPTKPELASLFKVTSLSTITVKDDILVVSGGWTRLVNILDKSNPKELYKFADSSMYAVIHGNFLFRARRFDGIEVWDISDPTSPSYITKRDNPTYRIVVEEESPFSTIVYAVCYHKAPLGEFNIFNFTGVELVTLGHISELTYGTQSMSKHEDMILLSDGNGVIVLDVSNKSDPTEVSRFGPSVYDTKIPRTRPFLAITAAANQLLKFYNITNITRAEEITEYPDLFFKIVKSFDFLTDDIIVVCMEELGLHFLNITVVDQGKPPELVGEYNLGFHTYQVKMSGDIIYIANSRGGFMVLDMSDSSDIFLAKEMRTYASGTLQEVYDLDVSDDGKILAVADWTTGMHLYDVSDPSDPQHVSVFEEMDNQLVFAVKLIGNLCFVSCGAGGLQIVNISVPSTPQLVGNFSNFSFSCYLAEIDLERGVAFCISQNEGFYVLNITDLTDISLVSHIVIPGGMLYKDIVSAVVGDDDRYIVYVACLSEGIFIYDFTDNYTQPVLTKQAKELASESTRALFLEKRDHPRYMYVADGSNGMYIYDISDAGNATHVFTVNAGYNLQSSLKTDVSHNRIVVGDDDNGIVLFRRNLVLKEDPKSTDFFCGKINITISAISPRGDYAYDTFEYDHGQDAMCSYSGQCITFDDCKCDQGFYGEDCSVKNCFGLWSNESVANVSDPNSICSGHGRCTGPDKCICDFTSQMWLGDQCEIATCANISSVEVYDVCNGKGRCNGWDKCECIEGSGYSGKFCQFYTCFGILADNVTHVCAGHGSCVSFDTCSCTIGYTSTTPLGPCDQYTCSGKNFRDEDVCSSFGKCVSYDECECEKGREGDDCTEWRCNGIKSTEIGVACKGHGDCIEEDVCQCNSFYEGVECQTYILYYYVGAPLGGLVGVTGLLVLFLIFACICICFCVCLIVFCLSLCVCSGILVKQTSSIRKYGKLKNFDMLMKEQEMEDDETQAHLKFNKSLFLVKMDDIKTISILGEGGSNSTVFKSLWNGQHVAFKCFKTRTLMNVQDKFDEFEAEVEILSSVAHPNIIRFFGACLHPPRVGILMEYCPKGEILDFVKDFREDTMNSYPIFQKIRLLMEVCSALQFLHARNIIHRDLKCENVLISKDDSAKLMDFGLSRCVESMDVAKTKRVGTSIYMAPEIIIGDYTEKCDVFSLAIMMYVLITEDEHPYSDIAGEFQIELKVANDPEFRPRMEHLEKALSSSNDDDMFEWMKDLIEKCWDHKSNERYSCEEIRDILNKKGSVESFEKKNIISRSESIRVKKEDLSEDEEEEEEKEDLGKLVKEQKEEIQRLLEENKKLKKDLKKYNEEDDDDSSD